MASTESCEVASGEVANGVEASRVEAGLDALRDSQNNDYHAWASRHPDKALEHAKARQARYQSLTADGPNNGKPWTEAEFVELMSDRPLLETAKLLGRSYNACRQARQRRLKMLGLHRPRHKDSETGYNEPVKGWDYD